MEQNKIVKNRRRYKGKVISDCNDKTIVVIVSTYKKDKLYKKPYLYSKKYHTHDPKNEAKNGDTVTIEECRLYSAKKHCRLIKINESAVSK